MGIFEAPSVSYKNDNYVSNVNNNVDKFINNNYDSQSSYEAFKSVLS